MAIVANTPPGSPIRGLLFIGIGVLVLLMALVSVVFTADLVTSGVRVRGSVTRLLAGPAHPEIAFTDSRGEKRTFVGNGFVSHRVGDSVGVLFDADAPDTSAVLDEPGALWFFDLATACLGTALVAGGIYVWRKKAAPQGGM